jgi:butyryl-CoA dehydrogenase
VLAGLNHKMGYRGTTNTMLNFGEGVHTPGGGPGAVGYLVGEPHKGLSYMFHMMNEARIGVGSGATALGYTGYLKSLDYARNRPQGRPVTARTPRRRRCRSCSTPTCADAARAEVLRRGRLCARALLRPPGRRRAHRRRPSRSADARTCCSTPDADRKSWPSQWCLEANSLAIQVLGGYGYTREYDVEQHYRDNRLNPIHEGTHGIQALDLLGRKVVMQGGAGLQLLVDSMAATATRAEALGGEPAELARRCGPRATASSTSPRTCGAPATSTSRWPTPRSTSRRSARRRRVDVAGAAARRARPGRRVLRRQAQAARYFFRSSCREHRGRSSTCCRAWTAPTLGHGRRLLLSVCGPHRPYRSPVTTLLRPLHHRARPGPRGRDRP